MYRVYSVFDNVSGVYSEPFNVMEIGNNTDSIAIRIFDSMVKEGTLLVDFPDNYTFVRIARYNPLTGEYENNREELVTASDIINNRKVKTNEI